MLLLAFALDAFAFCLIAGVVAALIVRGRKPIVPRRRGYTMPPPSVLLRLAAREGARGVIAAETGEQGEVRQWCKAQPDRHAYIAQGYIAAARDLIENQKDYPNA